MKEIINLTPHTVQIKDNLGKTFTYSASGHIARSFSKYKKVESVNGIPVQEEKEPFIDFGGVVIDENTDYIVSWQFAMKLKSINFKNIRNFLYPLSYKSNKENGKIISVPCLIRMT